MNVTQSKKGSEDAFTHALMERSMCTFREDVEKCFLGTGQPIRECFWTSLVPGTSASLLQPCDSHGMRIV